jgi:hypothetical protein
MKTLAMAVLITIALGACATQQPAPSGTAFTGEVWHWSEETGIVTLRQGGGQLVHVKVAPEQMSTLRLNQTTTIRGQQVAPPDIERVVLPPGQLVPKGQADVLETTGTVASLDPAGKAAITSARGPVEVWVATPTTAVRAGEAVRVRMQVQALDVLPAPVGQTPPPETPPTARVGSEPGDYAAVRGAVRAIDPAGRLTVETPRGPIQIWVPRADRYIVGQFVEVQTAVHPAR